MKSGERTSGGKSLVERDTGVRKHSAMTCPVSQTMLLLYELIARGVGNLHE